MSTTRREFLSLFGRSKPEKPGAPAGATYPLVPFGSGKPIYLADLDRCQPASALSRTWQPKQWRLYDFEAEGVEGVMLAVGQNSGAPDLEYPLRQTGAYAIYFGILSKYTESRLQVRLKDEPTFTILTPNALADEGLMWNEIQDGKHAYRQEDIEELFWKRAELGGKDQAVIIRQLKTQLRPGDPNAFGNDFMPCWLAYIKLVPLSHADHQAWHAERAGGESRRLFAADDSFTATGYLHFQTEADVRRQIEPYRDTDFARIYWEAGAGDQTYYPSKVGRLLDFSWVESPYRINDALVGRTYGDFQAQGIDPFRVALEAAHAIGLEFHASYRVAGFYFPAPEDEWNAGGLYHRHPEWRCLDRQGRQNPRLSYAYEGVREFVLALLQEVVAYPVDGISLLYNRRLPILGYDPPLRQTFTAQYGVDPTTLPENDPRWLAHTAEILTDFMRELRRQMRAEAARQRRQPIGITAVVMGTREENAFFGLDLATWVKEGLIDTLVPYTSAPDASSVAPSWEDPQAVDYFLGLTRNSSCRLAPNLMPRAMTPEQYKHRAHGLYQAGVQNLFCWDCFMRTNFDPSWTALSRLGHKTEVADWVARGSPAVARPRRKLSRLGDWDLSYLTPG